MYLFFLQLKTYGRMALISESSRPVGADRDARDL